MKLKNFEEAHQIKNKIDAYNSLIERLTESKEKGGVSIHVKARMKTYSIIDHTCVCVKNEPVADTPAFMLDDETDKILSGATQKYVDNCINIYRKRVDELVKYLDKL